MRTLLTLSFGCHLLLGTVSLGEIRVVSAAEPQVMTPAPTMSTVMTPALQGNKQVVEVPGGECSDRSHNDLLSNGSRGACPADRCFAETEDFSQPERALLAVRTVKGVDTLPALQFLSSIPETSFTGENGTGTVQHRSVIAFQLSSVVLRE